MGEERWVRASGHPSVLERLHREGEDVVLEAHAGGHEENHGRRDDHDEQAFARRPVGVLLVLHVVLVVLVVTSSLVLRRLRLPRLLLREPISLEARAGLNVFVVPEAVEVPAAQALLRCIAGRERAARIRGLALEQVADVAVDLPEVLQEQARQRLLDIRAPL